MLTPYEKAQAQLEALKTADHQANMTDNRYATSGRLDKAQSAIKAARERVKALGRGNYVYLVRKDLGLSQKELGRWLNPDVKDMSREVRRWEQGERPVPGTVRVLLWIFSQGIRPEHINRESNGE